MADTTPTSSCRFSTRISLRWLPEPAHEPTDTIVMSVKEWYLDLRMDKETNTIDWTIAGQRIVESQEPLKVSFTHVLDSNNSFEDVDCGTFISLANGDELETGSMSRPDRPGAPVTEYEEVWRELPFREGPDGAGKGISWVLESDDGDLDQVEGEVTVTKTFLGRVWGTYLALQQEQIQTRQKTPSGDWSVSKSGAEVSARREEWDSGWKERYVVGVNGKHLPSMARGLNDTDKESWRAPGSRVTVDGKWYVVRAYEEIQ